MLWHTSGTLKSSIIAPSRTSMGADTAGSGMLFVIGLFCHVIGLFCHVLGLFCHVIGLFCHVIGLFCHVIGLCCHVIGLFCHVIGLFCHAISLWMYALKEAEGEILVFDDSREIVRRNASDTKCVEV